MWYTPSVSLRYIKIENLEKYFFSQIYIFVFPVQKLQISIKLIEFIEKLLVKKHWNLIIFKNNVWLMCFF